MIDLYTWRTANGRKVSIMLEECGLPYNVHPVDITRGEQDAPDYRKVNPNRRIPAIFDSDGPGGRRQRVFESGAILLYLAEKTGRFLGDGPAVRLEAIQWLMFQMGGVGPMFGQDFHFRHQTADDAPPDAIDYGIKRYGDEALRLCGVLDYRLREFEFLAGPYTIADIATFPWTMRYEWQGISLDEFPNVKRWFEAIDARPGVRRGLAIPAG